MENERFYQQTITNTKDHDIYIGEVLLFEMNDLESEGLDKSDCHLFRSGRHKNDMPSVCTFGKFDDESRLANLKHILPIRPVITETVDLLTIERYPDKVRLKELSEEKSCLSLPENEICKPDFTGHYLL